jgi:hypothetical protein
MSALQFPRSAAAESGRRDCRQRAETWQAIFEKDAAMMERSQPHPLFGEWPLRAPEPDDGTKRTSRTAPLMSDHQTSILSIIRPFFEQD